MDDILQKLTLSYKKKRFSETNLSQVYAWMHQLAQAHYEPAKEFFYVCLTDVRTEWRLNAIRCLGFHYLLAEEDGSVERIRFRLEEDPSVLVRLAAASILGIQSKIWPDWVLIQTLKTDPSFDVRRTAFESILKLCGLTKEVILDESLKIREQKVLNLSEEVNKLIVAHKLLVDLI